jgi:hypothetical protein
MANLSNINNKFIVNDGGNILIGTTADVATVRLHVKNSSAAAVLRLTGGSDSWDFDTDYTANKLLIKSSGAAGTVMTLLGASGNVGIGTDSPNAPLDVVSFTSGSSGIQQWSYNTAPSSYRLQLNQIVSSGLVRYSFDQLNAGAGYNNVIVLDRGSVGIGTDLPITKLHVSDANAVVTIEATTNGQNCSTWYKANGNNQWETGCNIGAGQDYQIYDRLNSASRMVVGHDGDVTIPGNVGIGTTSPDVKLSVEDGDGGGAAAGTDSRTKLLINASTEAYMSFNTPALSFNGHRLNIAGATKGSFELWDYAADPQVRIASIDARPLTFCTTNTERMRIDSSGVVGIGMTPDPNFNSTYVLQLKSASTQTYMSIGDTVTGGGPLNGLVIGVDATGAHIVNREATTLDFHTNNGVKMTILSGGSVGIGNTNPYSVLDVDGVITNRTASSDPNFTTAVVGMSLTYAGSLQFTQGFAGTSSAGDTVVFTYSAGSWKSWSLDYTFASTNGLVKGTIGGYNNNSGGGSNFFLINNFGITAVATGSGQTVIVTFTGNFGIHMMCDMRYSQGGGDGSPRADRASLTYNS